MAEMTVVVRVWLPDRPGALGAVASRIGAVRGDVVAIDVLERGGGRAVDELTVRVPDESVLDLLVGEIGQVDGVDVEDVRPLVGGERDRAVAALDAAQQIVAADDPDDLLRITSRVTRQLTGADWVTVLDVARREFRAFAGTPAESPEYLSVFIAGAAEVGAIGELAFSPIDAELWMVVARAALPLRAAERQLLDQLAGIVTRSLTALRARSSASG